MSKAQDKLIENLKEQIEDKQSQRALKQYMLVIQQVIKEKLNLPESPLTFIKGSDTIYNINNISLIVSRYTPYTIENQ